MSRTTSKTASAAASAAAAMTTPAQLERLGEHLRKLRLLKGAERLEAMLQHAATNELPYAEFLEQILGEEVAAKTSKNIAMRTAMARFPFVKPLETFEFSYQPSIDAKQVQQLASCHFIEHGDNVIVLGPPGVGKTHLAVSLGLKAIEAGYRVLFTTAVDPFSLSGGACHSTDVYPALEKQEQAQAALVRGDRPGTDRPRLPPRETASYIRRASSDPIKPVVPETWATMREAARGPEQVATPLLARRSLASWCARDLSLRQLTEGAMDIQPPIPRRAAVVSTLPQCQTSVGQLRHAGRITLSSRTMAFTRSS